MKPVFLTGYMGSGKTAMGKLLATQLNYTFIDLDAYIEAKFHKTIASIFSEKGENEFRLIEKQCLHEVADFENTVISTGGGAPCFFDNMEFMNNRGLTIYLKLTVEHLAKRLETSAIGKRPLIADMDVDGLLNFISETLKVREPFYNKAQMCIAGDDNEIKEQISNIRLFD